MTTHSIGIGECKVSADPADILVTHALGSCIGLMLYDPLVRVGGLLHYMLPASGLDPAKARRKPCLFADTGIAELLQDVYALGAVKSRLIVMAAGGAQMFDSNGTFNIGLENQLALRRSLASAGVFLHKEEFGGVSSRTVRMDIATGKVMLRTAKPAPAIKPKVASLQHKTTEHEMIAQSRQKGVSRVL
jgi:chemotaxis protein CheD